MNSRLYQGMVWHSRGEPAYRFQYRVWYLCLDLAETDAVASKLRLLSHDRHNVTSFWERDYLALSTPEALAVPPAEAGGIEAGAVTPADAGPAVPPAEPGGIDRNTRRTELITVPRILGHAFNPASFLIDREDGAITGVRIEVHNTWGERHVYNLENRGDEPEYRSAATKAFYVSPFLPMEGGYRFDLREDDDGRLRINIALDGEDGEQLFAAGIDVRPLALSDANLARLLVTHPLVNLKTVAMIHWQGVKLWLKGVPFRANPSRASGKGGKQLWPRGH